MIYTPISARSGIVRFRNSPMGFIIYAKEQLADALFKLRKETRTHCPSLSEIINTSREIRDSNLPESSSKEMRLYPIPFAIN